MNAPAANVTRRRKPSEAWVARLKARPQAGPLYLALAQALARAIEAGELVAGERLPPQRVVAELLGVDFTTITRAYAQARQMGLVEAETGRGTFVRGGASAAGPLIDLSMNLPPPPGEISMRDIVSRGVAEVLKSGDPAALMTYRAGMGARRDRLTGVAWLAPRLGDLDPERVHIAPGGQSALAALLPLLAGPDDVVLADALTYPGFLAAARLHRVRAVSLPRWGRAFATELDRLCRSTKPRALYCTPSLHNPTTHTMSEAQRRAIVAAARKHDLAIIEDDAYGAFAPDSIPLVRLAPERTFHISTLSKCLSPGLRTAFVVSPEGEASARVQEALRASCLMPTPILSDLALRWIDSGEAHRMFVAIKAESAERMKLARQILPERVQSGPAGFHLWLDLPKGWALGPYIEAARARGVLTVGASAFAIDESAPQGVRISLGGPSDRSWLAQGLTALAELEGGDRPAHATV